MIKFLKKTFNKFDHWLSYSPPGSMSSKGWRLFREEFKEKAPIRYYFHNDFRKNFVWPFKWKYRDGKYWIRYRTFDRYHIVDTGLKPDYYEIDTRMLHASFNMLKEFVEVEQAWSSYCWSDEYKKASWCEKHMPFYRVFYPFRRPDIGITHFEWASTLDDPSLPPHQRMELQAEAARETLILYNWWVNERPNRKEVVVPSYKNQGLGDIMSSLDSDFDRTAPDYVEHEKAMTERMDQEEAWKQEDEDMLIRLVKIRRSLWT